MKFLQFDKKLFFLLIIDSTRWDGTTRWGLVSVSTILRHHFPIIPVINLTRYDLIFQINLFLTNLNLIFEVVKMELDLILTQIWELIVSGGYFGWHFKVSGVIMICVYILFVLRLIH